MKKLIPFLLMAALALTACVVKENPVENPQEEVSEEVPEEAPEVTDPISISSPTPEATLTKVTLSEEQQAYVSGSNAFAFKCLSSLYREGGSSLVFSPLSLQYALAMTVNGASGDTAAEITGALGFGPDTEALNAYCNLLMNQLPALDPDVEIKLADAVVVDRRFPLQPAFVNTMSDVYYAPVEYLNFSDRKKTVDRINEWASRNTNGLIYPFLQENDLAQAIAVLLNALYFKAPWSHSINGTMFLPEYTQKEEPFYLDGGGKAKVDLMPTSHYFGYAEHEGYRMVEIPYSSGRFAMYVLLPDEVGKQGLKKLMERLPQESWEELLGSLTYTTEVHLLLPKFETSCTFPLVPTLEGLGIHKAFDSSAATFDRMFAGNGDFFIGNVLQKARIKVTEWGTEAAAVTAVLMAGASMIVPPQADFFVDHPFAYVIAERSSGTILFEGVFTGE